MDKKLKYFTFREFDLFSVLIMDKDIYIHFRLISYIPIFLYFSENKLLSFIRVNKTFPL